MRCPAPEELVRFQEGWLERGKMMEVSSHLDGCPRCRSELDALVRAGRLLEALPRPAATPQLWAGVAAGLAREKEHRFRAPLWWKPAAALGAAAAVALFVLAGTLSRPELPVTAGQSFVEHHAFLSLRDPLADRAAIGLTLATAEGDAP